MLRRRAGTTFSCGRFQGVRMRGSLIAVGSALIAVACSSQKPAARMDEAGLSRLNESQIEPVDDARGEEGRAHDAAARTRGNGAGARAPLEVGRRGRGG